MIKNIEITSMSSDFKGLCSYDGKKHFVIGGLVGDVVDIEVFKETSKYNLARIVNFTKKSENRCNCKCKYAIECGGCSLQHINAEFYYKIKLENLCKNISNSGFSVDINNVEVFKVLEGKRRRINLKYKNKKYGFFKNISNDIIEIDECINIENNINNFIKIFKNIKITNLDSIDITKCDNGLNITLIMEKEPNLNDFKKLNIFNNENSDINCINYTYKNEKEFITIFKNRDSKLELDGININLPNSCFLQATKDSQDFIINIVKKYLNQYKNIADLYCGIGTYSFPLSKTSNVYSFEGDNNMTSSIKNNLNKVKINNIIAKTRDLFNQPLSERELNDFEAVVINPPRNGSENQCRTLAKSNIKKIIYVSCNPESFSRDLSLFNNKFRIEKLFLVDQFFWSDHSECVCILDRV